MFSVTKRLDFCYGHRLLDHAGKCRNLHGHNGTAEISLESGRLGPGEMVTDFERIKSSVREWIERELDHKTLLNAKDPLVAALRAQGQEVLVLDGNPTAEALARLIFERCRDLGLPVASVRVWETPSSNALYRP